ncbi:general substrate transporter [Atractiella rhizophila]|nr:general substrate transporter [Atractiella rhizophila]
MATVKTPVSSHASLSSGSDEKFSQDLKYDDTALPEAEVVRVEEAGNAAYAQALLEGAKLPRWSKAAFTIYACSAVSFLCSCTSGYDGSLMTAINGMKHYQQEITPGGGSLNKSTGIIFSIYTIGQLSGALTLAGPISDRWGRRYGMLAGACTIIVGAAIISSSHSKEQFIAGRFVLGFGIALAIVAAPTFCIEVSPPHWRGKITGLYNSGWNGGAIPAAAITFGTSFVNSTWSWRVPLILQAVPATLVICTCLLLPESPRWLYANGRQQEAIDFLVKYHGNGDPNHPLVKLEIEEFHENIKQDAADKRWWDVRPLVATKNARWRFAMVAFMGISGQFAGNGLGYFQLNIYETLGYGYTERFAMNLGGSCLSALASVTGSLLADRMPRRRVLPLGTFACAVCLAAYVAAGARFEASHSTSKPLGSLGAAFFYFFQISYAFTYTPLQSLYPAECLENGIRAKGVAAKIVVVSCVAFISLYCTPIGLENIGWRYVIVYVGWDCIAATIWYFIAVETVGRTLEELDEVFSAPNPVKASKQKRKVALRRTGEAVVV